MEGWLGALEMHAKTLYENLLPSKITLDLDHSLPLFSLDDQMVKLAPSSHMYY